MVDSKAGAALAPKPEQKNGSTTPAVTIAPVKKLVNADDVPPLEDRLHRLNQLFDLQNKYNRLKASLLKLKTFKFKKEGDYTGITIRDDGRNDFSTGNPEVCEEVVKFMIATIEKKIKELEPQLKW